MSYNNLSINLGWFNRVYTNLTTANVNMINSRITVCTLKCSTSIMNLHVVLIKSSSEEKHVYVRLFDKYQIVYMYH